MTRFASLGELRAACLDLPIGDAKAAAAVAAREAVLTKPPRSLGRLEEAVAWLASWQGASRPHLDNVEILVFAGNHGVTAQGVSAYPAAVTAQMVANFASGGAAINQLARADGAELRVVALDLDAPTVDFTKAPAMDEAAHMADYMPRTSGTPLQTFKSAAREAGDGSWPVTSRCRTCSRHVRNGFHGRVPDQLVPRRNQHRNSR